MEPSLAGPRRPQDRVALGGVPDELPGRLPGHGRGAAEAGRGRRRERGDRPRVGGHRRDHLVHQHLEPGGDGRRRAARPERRRARACRSSPVAKTSLAPGSKAVTGYLERAGLMAPLAELGFALAGYGCTTCIGNSGPLDEPVAKAVEADELVVAAVLSGNRNFEGRVHPLVRAAYLASPPLVVAYALAGRMDIDLTTEPLGTASDGTPGPARRHLAVAGRGPRGHGGDDRPGAVPRHVRGRVRGRRAMALAADPVGRPLRLGRGVDVHRQPAVLPGPDRRAGAAHRHRRRPGRSRCWATR